MSALDPTSRHPFPVVPVAVFALLALVTCLFWLLPDVGAGPTAHHTALQGGPEAVREHRYERHPDGSLAACEVALSIRDVAIVRRAVFAADGTVDPAASGLRRAGVRERDLTAIEIADLRTVGLRGPDQLGKAMPASLTAER